MYGAHACVGRKDARAGCQAQRRAGNLWANRSIGWRPALRPLEVGRPARRLLLVSELSCTPPSGSLWPIRTVLLEKNGVIEACTSGISGAWTLLQRCTLTTGLVYFNDSQSTKCPSHLYRISSP